MATKKEIIELMKKQLDQQQTQLALQQEQMQHQRKQNETQMEAILKSLQLIASSNENSNEASERPANADVSQTAYAVPKFAAFDSSSELWSDYNLRFQTFVKAYSVPESKVAQIFLTNQSVATYKLLQNLCSSNSLA